MTGKKWQKRLIFIMMCAAFVFHTPSVYAQDDENDFIIADGVLEKYNGTDSEVVIPEGVTVIGKKAFERNKTIKKVTLPSTLTTIDDYAFQYCANLMIPDFPSGMHSIGNGAFESCATNTTEVTISNVPYIDSWAFHLCGCEKAVINGNNTTIAWRAFSSGFVGAQDCYDLDYLKEAVLNGTFSKIEGVFDGRGKLENVTINGTIESLTNGFYGCQALKTLTVNGDIDEISSTILNGDGTEGVFGSSPDLTIYGREGSNIQEYARKYEIPFVVIEAEEVPEPEKEICLTEANTSISKIDMQTLVDINQSDDVTIRTSEGVVFTFPKGSMKMIEKDEFDFGVKIITEYDGADIKGTAKDEFAFRINYNYSGELPGTAQVSIPIDRKWNGKELYYYHVDSNGNLIDQNVSAIAENGVYTVPLSHCSDYIAVSKKLSSGNDNRPSVGGNKNQATDSIDKNTEANLSNDQRTVSDGSAADTDNRAQAIFTPASVSNDTNTAQTVNTNNSANGTVSNTSPQTGDQSPLLLYIILVSITAGIVLKGAKHRISLK